MSLEARFVLLHSLQTHAILRAKYIQFLPMGMRVAETASKGVEYHLHPINIISSHVHIQVSGMYYPFLINYEYNCMSNIYTQHISCLYVHADQLPNLLTKNMHNIIFID